MSLAPDDPRHGTQNGYVNLKCRCDRCRHAWREYHRAYLHRSARAVPREDYLDALRQNKLHGTEGAYKRCRCDACRHAAAIARWERRQVGGGVLTHNSNGYANGCRCDICREAHRVYRAEFRAARKRQAA